MVRRACAFTKRPWWNPLAEMHMIWHPIRLFSTDWKIFPRKMRRTRSSFSGCLLIYCYKDDLRWWILVVILLENDRDKVSLDIVIRSTWLSGNHKKSLGSEDISSEVYFSFRTEITLLVSLYRKSDKLRWRLLIFLEIASKGIWSLFLDSQHLWSGALGFSM